MRRGVGSKKASWGPGPGAVLLQDTPTTAEHKRWSGGPGCGSVDSRRLACPLQLFCKASTASQSQSAWALGSSVGSLWVKVSVAAPGPGDGLCPGWSCGPRPWPSRKRRKKSRAVGVGGVLGWRSGCSR